MAVIVEVPAWLWDEDVEPDSPVTLAAFNGPDKAAVLVVSSEHAAALVALLRDAGTLSAPEPFMELRLVRGL